jgi:hypothetical protein
MKKIKNFKKFESVQDEDEFDYDYVKQCFIDLIESAKIKYIDDDFVVIRYEQMADPGNNFRGYTTDGIPLLDIDSYLKDLDETKEIMIDLKTGINKVLDEYPDYKYTISYDDGQVRNYGEAFNEPLIKLSIWCTH